jgi:hypothetical protein
MSDEGLFAIAESIGNAFRGEGDHALETINLVDALIEIAAAQNRQVSELQAISQNLYLLAKAIEEHE